jgi:hypothetical protein
MSHCLDRCMLLAAAVIAVAWPGAAPALAQAAEFKGMPRVSRELQDRIAPPDMAFDLDWFLPAPGLDSLLGKWSSFGSEHTFRNGQQNSLNMMIWHVTLSNIAQTLGRW